MLWWQSALLFFAHSKWACLQAHSRNLIVDTRVGTLFFLWTPVSPSWAEEQRMESYSNLSKMLSKSVAPSRPWAAGSLHCCQSTQRPQDSDCLPSWEHLHGWTVGCLWLFAFPFSKMFIHCHQICLTSPNPLSSFAPFSWSLRAFWMSSTLLAHFPSVNFCGGPKDLSQVCDAQCVWCALAPR